MRKLQVSTRKRRKLSEEHKRKISKTNKSLGVGKWMKGRKLSQETKNKIILNHRRCQTPETRIKISEAKRGEKSHFWKGGLTPINKTIRHSLEYRLWREAIFKRDNFMCTECKVRSEKERTIILHADHIKPFAHYPELRLDTNNGRTLCRACHLKTPTYGTHLNIYG